MGSAGSQALRAAVAVGRRVGLPVRDPVVLSDAFNLVVHLAPSPVVARVPTVTARLRPDVLEWVRREIAVGTHLDATTDLADPGCAPARSSCPCWGHPSPTSTRS